MTVITILYSRLSKQTVTVTEVRTQFFVHFDFYSVYYELFLKLRESTRNFSSFLDT